MNLQKELDILLDNIGRSGTVPQLVLHACCAPCSSYVLEYLSRHFAIIIGWYNPNVFPEDEHSLRFDALSDMLGKMVFANPVELVRLPYEPDAFIAAIRGLEGEPEGGARCKICFRLRLEQTAKLAAHRGAEYFSTTLSVGPRKNAALLYKIAGEIAEEHGVAALPGDFKKRGGYARSVEISREMGIYRQNHCGCIYSAQRIENSSCADSDD